MLIVYVFVAWLGLKSSMQSDVMQCLTMKEAHDEQQSKCTTEGGQTTLHGDKCTSVRTFKDFKNDTGTAHILPFCMVEQKWETCARLCEIEIGYSCWHYGTPLTPALVRHDAYGGEKCLEIGVCTIPGQFSQPTCKLRGGQKPCYPICGFPEIACLWNITEAHDNSMKYKNLKWPSEYHEAECIDKISPKQLDNDTAPLANLTNCGLSDCLFTNIPTNQQQAAASVMTTLTGADFSLESSLITESKCFRLKYWSNQPLGQVLMNNSSGIPVVRLCELRTDEEAGIGCRRVDDLMTSYNGQRSTTVYGRPCRRWEDIASEELIHNSTEAAEDYRYDELLLRHNLCRNPSRSSMGPYCYVTNGPNTREPCFPQCLVKSPNTMFNNCLRKNFLTRPEGFDPREPRRNSFPLGDTGMDISGNLCTDFTNNLYDKDPDPHVCQYKSDGNEGLTVCKSSSIPCQLACEDVNLHKCMPRNKLSTWFYTGPKNKTSEGRLCAKWSMNEQQKAILLQAYGPHIVDLYSIIKVDNNLCKNVILAGQGQKYSHLATVGPEGVDQYHFWADQGPVCFDQDNNLLKPCFSACEDLLMEETGKFNGKNEEMRRHYTGTKSTDVQAKKCAQWKNYQPKHVNHLPDIFDGANCRNPDNDKNGPWCFVKEGTAFRKSHCFNRDDGLQFSAEVPRYRTELANIKDEVVPVEKQNKTVDDDENRKSRNKDPYSDEYDVDQKLDTEAQPAIIVAVVLFVLLVLILLAGALIYRKNHPEMIAKRKAQIKKLREKAKLRAKRKQLAPSEAISANESGAQQTTVANQTEYTEGGGDTENMPSRTEKSVKILKKDLKFAGKKASKVKSAKSPKKPKATKTQELETNKFTTEFPSQN